MKSRFIQFIQYIFTINLLLIVGCNQRVHLAKSLETPAWQSRSEGMDMLIKFRIKDRQYDSTEIYQRDGLYYAARNDRKFLYSPEEKSEHLLDSTIYIFTPTRTYRRNFSKGYPNGQWLYYYEPNSIPYRIETYRDGQLIKREEVNHSPKK